MESDRNRAISDLKMHISLRENDKKKLQAILAFSQVPERRGQAAVDLANVLKDIRIAMDEVTRLESQE